MVGKKSRCPDCGEKLRVPCSSDEISPAEINPRLHGVYDLIDSVNSLDFGKESLIALVQKYNELVDIVRLKNMQVEARDNLSMKLQGELWEHEAARCEMADNQNHLKMEIRTLKEQLARVSESGESPRVVQHVEHIEVEWNEGENASANERVDALTKQVEV